MRYGCRGRCLEIDARSEAPCPLADDPHAEANRLVFDGGLELSIADDDDLGSQTLDSKVGVRGAPPLCHVQGRVGKPVEWQRQEVGVNRQHIRPNENPRARSAGMRRCVASTVWR